MRLRALGVAAALSAAVAPQDSGAVVRPKGAEEPLVSADRAPRLHRTIDWKTVSSVKLAGWTAMWDRDTDVPLRLWGRTPPIAGAIANADLAEAAARAFLAEHLGVLAPGAKASDFILASNVLSPKGDIRSIGFVQHAAGMQVLGGAIGISFKADRISLVTSTALPHVTVQRPMHRLVPASLTSQAERWLRAAGHSVTVTRALAPQPLVVPIVRPRIGSRPDIEYRIAEQLDVAATDSPNAWHVWVDASSGAPIARRSKLTYASGKVLFDVPDRYPGSTRTARPALFASVTVDGVAATAAADGTVTWNGAGSATVRARGPLINVTTAGTAATTALQLMTGGSVTWSEAASETGDAQLSAFVHAAVVKDFIKTRVNPGLAWLDKSLVVSVNESGGCNAFSTGDDIHFLRKNNRCENTARLADVVYHEFGHSLHRQSIIEGVGSFDGALSEGLSDTLAMLLTHDHGMARGFFLSNPTSPMRDLNPPNKEKKWGVDTTGEVHDDGEIIGGTFWDLMFALETSLGKDAGYEKTLEIFYSVMQRASDIPSSYAEALLGDDDDGDLSNGTPNMCTIHAAFDAHNLASGAPPMGTIDKPIRTGYSVAVSAKTGGSAACPAPEITAGEITWRLRGGTDASIAMTLANEQLTGAMPSQPNGSVIQYKVTLTLANGTKVTYPSNAADPYYEFYVGPVEKLWCADFEAGATEWTSSMDWEAGMPRGLGGDPKLAVSGAAVYGIDLTKDGAYAASAMSFAESPEIDLKGKTGARLQYQRWLAIEDGFYDDARIVVNGTEAWKNFASATDPQQAGVHHVDREWRFSDVELAAFEASGKVKLRFELTGDEGLQFGGWTLDDVCVVVPAQGSGGSSCGNGAVDSPETCDDGNVSDGDGCSSTCENEADGDGGGGEPDSGGAGCCSVGGGPEGALALALLTLGLVLRKRSRSREL